MSLRNSNYESQRPLRLGERKKGLLALTGLTGRRTGAEMQDFPLVYQKAMIPLSRAMATAWVRFAAFPENG
jgi:hypothetical protein